jgi:hypothetical protein
MEEMLASLRLGWLGQSLPQEGSALSTKTVLPRKADSLDHVFLLLDGQEGSSSLERLEGEALGLWVGSWGIGRSASHLSPLAAEGGGDEDGGLPPLYLGVLPLPSGGPRDPEAEGYRYLCGYAGHAIRTAERRVGPLRDHEDIIHQICVEWLEQAGPPHEAFPKLLEKAPAEMQLLRETVNRVIARVIYQQRRRLMVTDFTDWPAPARAAEKEWIEFKSDCEKGVGSLTPQEWQILELRRQGKTFAEIGADIGVPRQRVWEIYHGVETRLQQVYRKSDL